MLSAVYAIVVCLSVCLPVCVSVPFRYCITTAERRITQIMPHDGFSSEIFCSCRISTDKCLAQSFCHSRASCYICNGVCVFGAGQLVCVTGQWLCEDDLTCISEELVCNGEMDCFDGSDELACGPYMLLSCHYYAAISSVCLSNSNIA